MSDNLIRLSKRLSDLGIASRRQADAWIEKGWVKVDDHIAVLGEKVTPTQRIRISPKARAEQARLVTVLINKPVGYVCSRRRQDTAPTIYELLPADLQSLKTVGRLDKDSEGLILLTNDGEFGFQMTHPKFAKHKLYEVELDRALEPLHQQMIGDFGVELKDGRSQLGLTKLDDGRRRWQVEMSEGRNRQIRRTFGALGYTVVQLKRLEFGPYRLSGLQPGEWCELTKANSGADGKA